MTKEILKEKINELTTIDKAKLLGWVNALPNNSNLKPNVFKPGDVLMHPVFGHPYVLFEFKDGHWICGLLTTEEECSEILEACSSRFFSINFFTKILFTVKEPVGNYRAMYDNKKHMNSIYSKLKEIFK